MADTRDILPCVEAPGVSVSLDRRMHVAALRYFAGDGPFAHAVRASVGASLPDRLCATYWAPLGVESIMAWRSPTETLFLSAAAVLLEKLEADVASLRDGCLVVQTGGMCVLRASGARVADLFARMGGQGVLPPLGGARRSRLAEISALAIQVQSGESLLVVERIYAEHLMHWIRSSATDFEAT